jgi:Ca-activated chloride channel family protein
VAFTLRTDRKLIRAAGGSRRFLCAGIHAPEAPPRPGRLPVNLAFVLDRSGSMSGAKIANAREAVLHGIRSLRPEDRFAVVAYDDLVDLVVPTTSATPEARENAERLVSRIQPRGNTNLHAGWLRGCEQVAQHLSDDAVGRCLLLTDGLANSGLTSDVELVAQCAAWREKRVVTTAFGVGDDFDEVLLRRMADAGGGHFEFIESAVQIPDFVASEVGEALAIAVREAVLVVEAGEGAAVESLNDFPVRRDGKAFLVEVGSLFGGQELNPILRVTFPAGEEGAAREVLVRLEDQDRVFGRPTARVTFTWARHGDSDQQARDRSLDRRVAALYAARAERDALEKNRAHDLGGARAVLDECIRHLRRSAADDPEIRATLEDLERKGHEYSRVLDATARKRSHYTTSLILKERYMRKAQRMRGPAVKVNVVAAAYLGGLIDPVMAHLSAADPDLFAELVLDPGMMGAGATSPALEPGLEIQLLDDVLSKAVPADVSIVFTPLAFSDSWFSHWHDSRRAAVVSLAGWDGGWAVSTEAFVAYEVILHGLRALGPWWTPDQWMHAETRGCLFDFCRRRQDMEIKLQAADLCPSCRAALDRAGVPLDRLQRLLEVIRTLAVPATVVH